MATAAEISEIIKLYVGYYNRAPDPDGLNFWIDAFDNGFDLDAMAEDFSTQPETLANYPFFLNPSPSDGDLGTFVDAVYQNLFNRNPDDLGRAFWIEKIGSGEFTVGQAISLIIAGATTSPDQDVVANKVAAGRDFYIKTNALPPYDFDADDIEEATNLQASVTADPASVTAAAAQTDAYIASLNAVSINLTSDVDSPGGGGAGVDTQGSDGSDAYNGTVSDTDGGTLQNADSIAAGAGVDLLDIRVISTTSNSVSGTTTITATGLERINITDQSNSSANYTFNLDSVDGETEITVADTASGTDIEIDDVDDNVTFRLVDHLGDLELLFKGDRSGTTDDAINIYVENIGNEEDEVFGEVQIENSGEGNFEIGNIVTGGTTVSLLNLDGMELETLNITGSQRLLLEDSGDGFELLESVDASGMTGGGLNINAENTEVTSFSFMGSAFGDELFLDNDLFNNPNTMSLDGGGATDTLTVENFSNLSGASVNQATSFEILKSHNSSISLDADDFDINTFVFNNQTTNQSRLNIRGLDGDDLFVFTDDQGRGDETIRFSAPVAGQTLNMELAAREGGGGEVRILANTSTNNAAAIGFADSNITTVNVISSGPTENANVIRGVDNGSSLYYAFDNDGGPSNFTISGAQALTITAEVGVILNASSDERGFRDNVSLDGSAATGDLRIAGSGTADAISGGSGDDIFYSLGGNDVLTGNGGMDQFRYDDWSGTDQITDFTAGEDKIGFASGSFGNTDATEDGTVLATDDYIENLSNVASMTGAESSKLVELQLAASQTQIEDTTTNATNTYLLVFNSTSGEAEIWYDVNWDTTSAREHVLTIDGIDSVEQLIGLSNTDFVEYEY